MSVDDKITNPEGGAISRMTLPIDDGHGASGRAERAPELEPLTILKGLRVLVADDEATIRKIFNRIGRRYGARMTLVADASEAIEQLQRQDFDLLFLDVRMPEGGGPAVFEWIRSNRPMIGPRTVFVSGDFSTEMSDIVGRQYPRTLQKPFTRRELGDIARAALETVQPEDPSS